MIKTNFLNSEQNDKGTSIQSTLTKWLNMINLRCHWYMDKKYTYFEYINVKEFEQNVKHIKSQDVLHNFEYQFFFQNSFRIFLICIMNKMVWLFLTSNSSYVFFMDVPNRVLYNRWQRRICTLSVQLYSVVFLENMSTNLRKFRFPCCIWHLWRRV